MLFDKAVNFSDFEVSAKDEWEWIINRTIVTGNVCRKGGKPIQFYFVYHKSSNWRRTVCKSSGLLVYLK